MANRKKGLRGGLPEDGVMRFICFSAIPLIVIILIFVIVRMDRPTKEERQTDISAAAVQTADSNGDGSDAGNEPGSEIETSAGAGEENGLEAETGAGEENGSEPETGAEAETGSGAENGSEAETAAETVSQPDPMELPLIQDGVSGLTALIETYCEAREECDPELMAVVFGNTDMTEIEKAEEKERMELVKASVKSYENISCYSVQGPEDGSYVVFPYYEIKYRSSETLVPTLSWGYVKQSSDGQYYMVQDIDEEVKEYIRAVCQKPEVKAVMAQVQKKQEEAVNSDAALQDIYGGGSGSEVIIGEKVGTE